MKFFQPNLYYEAYKDIDFHLLKSKGINTIFFDVDNTLVPHDCEIANDELIDYINKIKDMGFNVYVISNNNEERVKKFAQSLGIKYYAFAMKPLKKTYRKIVEENNLHDYNIAIVGDQLLTDVLGGNRMNYLTIYTKPLVTRDITYTKVNRVFEKVILKYLNKANKLNQGVYYD